MKMNKNKLKELVRHIVKEAVGIMSEEHERGEWWIDESGSTIFADGNVGDYDHEAIVVQNLVHIILSHFGIEEDEPGELASYEDTIRDNLIDDGRLSEEELKIWNNEEGGGGPMDIIIARLLEDKVFETTEQTNDAVSIAYGSSKDARDYAMHYWRWKVMKTYGKEIDIQTWFLKPDDLGIIVRGVNSIVENTDDPDDSDKEVGEDGYEGPRVNVTVQATGKYFNDIPLAVLEKKMPQNLHNYQSGVHVGYTEESLTEDYHHLHKGYRLYEGGDNIIAIFEDNSRLQFEVHYRNNHGMDKEKWRHRAFTTWKSVANEIYRDVELTEVGNPIEKSWKQAFAEALNHPKLQEFVRRNKHKKVFDQKNS